MTLPGPTSSAATTIRCAVIGQPIAHSKSPAIHLGFAAQFDLPLRFDRIDCAPAAFEQTVQDFFKAGGRGLSVTLPHKPAALALAVFASERARAAGAANTLGLWSATTRAMVDDASPPLWADNTDGIGLVRDLKRLGISVAGQRVLVLGAGGAAAGVLTALRAEQPAALAVKNRSAERASELLARLQRAADDVHGDAHVATAVPYRVATSADAPYTLVISTVSAGAADLLQGLSLATDAAGYDLNYGERAEPALAAMRALGLNSCHDGRGMLIEQAAEAFERWHGLKPDTRPLHNSQF